MTQNPDDFNPPLKPKICKKSDKMVKEDFETRLNATQKRKDLKVSEILRQIDEKIMSECTFKPNLTEKSMKMMKNTESFRGCNDFKNLNYETKLEIYRE